MSRRGQSLPPEFSEKPPRSRCVKIICVSWKVLTCIISHVTLVSLVVGYCLGGAYLFQHLELENEIQVKKSIRLKRLNVTDYVWEMTENTDVLREVEWTQKVEQRLEIFEQEILLAMKKEGWDGDENITTVQWTFEGSLFYSIIVITTIGYGHIAPRTQYGKVTTIFYAILGIPLMLLCLSNIGDVMASSFRFLYWRVCCFVCTREPRRRRNRFSSRSRNRLSRSQPPPSVAIRRSIRSSQRSADSGFATAYDLQCAGGGLQHAYSDPELRYNTNIELPPSRGNGDFYRERERGRDRRHFDNNNFDYNRQNNQQSNRNQQPSRFANRSRNRERLRDCHTIEREKNLTRGRPQYDSNDDLEITPSKRTQSTRSMRASSVGRDINRVYSQTLPGGGRNRSNTNASKVRAKSVDPRSSSAALQFDDVNEELARKTPILCNRYAIDDLERRTSNNRHKRISLDETPSQIDSDRRIGGRNGNRRNTSMPPQSRSGRERDCERDRNLQYPQHNQQQHLQNSSRYGNQLEIPNRSFGMGSDSNASGRNRYSDRDRYYNHNNNQNQQRSSRCDDDFYNDDFDDVLEMQPIRRERRSRRVAAMPPSPRIMSPMGFAIHRQAKIRVFADDDSYYDDELDSYGNLSPDNRPVPIWLCVFLVVSYIIAGAFIFQAQEGWSFLDATYFCFITLTTIGFGDFVPSTNNDKNPRTSIALCSLYLLFGISLLAMSFNLVQEEVIANVKDVARRLGILKDQEQIEE